MKPPDLGKWQETITLECVSVRDMVLEVWSDIYVLNHSVTHAPYEMYYNWWNGCGTINYFSRDLLIGFLIS